jgi:hypothetical protein
MHRFISGLVIVAAAAAAAVNLCAQEGLDLGEMALGMKHNQESLKDYTWQSRITFAVNGVQKRVDEYRIRYDNSGFLERLQVSSTTDKQKVRRADGKKLSKDEREAAHDFAVEVKSQLDGYLSPLFAEKAVKTAAVTADEATYMLRSQDVVKAGDTVEITLDRATHRPLTLKATSTVGDSPVTLEVSFETLDFGPSHPVNSVTRSTWQGLELTITTADSNFGPR